MNQSADHDAVEDRQLEHAIAEFLRRLDQGEMVDRARFLQEHLSCAEGLREYFASMDQVERMAGPPVPGQAAAGEPAAGPGRSPGPREDWAHKSFPFSFGRYRVKARLGQGGMGTVFLADDTQVERKVALKIPQLGDREEDRQWLQRFVREGKTHVQHPNICTIYDTGILDGQPFISMAYIKGQPLAALITPDKLLPEREIAILMRLIALAMHAAHQAGIVHRDLKPSNIMIDEQGQPIVMDFGLARRMTGEVGRITSKGRVIGTPAYLSPEQLERNPDGVTHSTDIFSLGVTYYELLTGYRPFQGTLTQILRQIQDQSPEPPSRLRPGLDRTLEAICLRMMAKRPVDRFATMKAVADELDGWLKQRTALSETATELHLLRQQVKLLSIGGAVAAGGLALFEIAELLAPHFGGGEEAHAEGHHPADEPHSEGHHAADEPHPPAPSHDDGWHSPFEDLIPEHAPIVKADPHFGTPEHDRAFWDGQQSYADTCAIRCQEYILQQFTGMDIPENKLVNEAREHGWYTPGGGTSMQDVGNLLELHGIAVNRYTDANVFHLAHELAEGHKVIIGVESGVLWGQNSTMDSMLETIHGHFGLGGGADHAVVVSGIDTTDPYHVKVIISDPGDGQAVASYPLEQFLHAWEGSHFYMVATQEPAPAHLPEMVHFDYAAGHIDAIADVPYEQLMEQYAHHPEGLEHVLDHFAQEHFADSAGHDHHDPHGHSHSDSAGHDHHDFGHQDDHHAGHDHHDFGHQDDHHDLSHHDDHHGFHDPGDHHAYDAPDHDDIAPHYDNPGHEDHHSADDSSDWP
jgi:serine/threonine protein kinase